MSSQVIEIAREKISCTQIAPNIDGFIVEKIMATYAQDTKKLHLPRIVGRAGGIGKADKIDKLSLSVRGALGGVPPLF